MARSPEAVARAKRNYLARHPDRRKASVAAYYARNKEKIAAYHRELWRTRRAELAPKRKKYKQEHPKATVASVRRWQERNPEKVRVYKTTTRAKRRAAGGRLTQGLIGRLHMEQQGACAYCREPLVKYHVDHILPIALGGKNDDNNIQLLCPPCNRAKGPKHPEAFLRTLMGAV